jgi:hypothetical protein
MLNKKQKTKKPNKKKEKKKKKRKKGTCNCLIGIDSFETLS